MRRGSESGFVATEFAFGVAVLVLPVALLVLTFPRWSERQVTARVIAREVARRAARDGLCDTGAARAVGATMARNLGVASRRRDGRPRVRRRRGTGAGERRRGPGHGPHARGPGARRRRGRRVVVDGAPPGTGRSLRVGPMKTEPDEQPRELGTVTLWLLGVCMLLFALGGISVDLWRAFSARRSLANAADAAALAGASAIDEDGVPPTRRRAARPAQSRSHGRGRTSARQLEPAALRGVDVHADRDAVTVVVHGDVGFTLLVVLDPDGDLAGPRDRHRDASAGRMRRLTAGVTALVLVVVGLAPPAAAQTAGGGELGPDYVRATASDLGAGTFPGAGLPAVAPAVDPPYTWERADTGGRCVVFAGAVPAELARWVSPLPGLDLFPYAPLQIGALQGGVPGAVRLDGDAPLPPGAVLAGDVRHRHRDPARRWTGYLLRAPLRVTRSAAPAGAAGRRNDLAADTVAACAHPVVASRDPRLARDRQPRVALLG